MAKVEIKKYYDIKNMIQGAQDGMLEFAGEVRKNMRIRAPFGIGTLRGSFNVTGPYVQMDRLTVSIETPVEYAEKQDQGIFRHMPYVGRKDGGQSSFMERSDSKGSRIQKYRRGYYLTTRGKLFPTTIYQSEYVELAMQDAGGETEMMNKVEKSMVRYLEAHSG